MELLDAQTARLASLEAQISAAEYIHSGLAALNWSLAAFEGKMRLTEEDLQPFVRVMGELLDSKMSEYVDTRLLTVGEAAEWLRLTKGHIYQLTMKKQIPFPKTGRGLLFRRSELMEWMRENAKR